MVGFTYERKEYQDYLKKITHKGTYQDYENTIYEMVNIGKNIVEHGLHCHWLIDQIDNFYYGDLFFPIPKDTSSDLYFEAGKIIGTLNRLGIKCNNSCFYFNKVLHGFMYTLVVVEADDGPDLYNGQTRTFVVR